MRRLIVGDRTKTKATSKALLECALSGLDKQDKRLQSRLLSDIDSGFVGRAHSNLDVLFSIARARRAIELARDGLSENWSCLSFVCGAWFLRQCQRQLTTTENEAMTYVTGLAMANLRTLDQILEFNYAEQTTCFVSADPESGRNALRTLHEEGQELLAWFHSHPGRGVKATAPSSEDMDHQSDLEKGGYQAIGGIFTRDGHVRFFSTGLQFRIDVIGDRAEQVDETVFRIT